MVESDHDRGLAEVSGRSRPGDGAAPDAQVLPPGTERYAAGKARRSWELVLCGWRGHCVVGSDAARLRVEDALLAREDPAVPGQRWLRCLRCDAWLPFPAPAQARREHLPAPAEVVVPLRGRGLRDRLVLRLIAIDRALHFLLLAALAVAIFSLAGHRSVLRADFYRVLADLQGGLLHSARAGHGFLHDVNLLLSLESRKLMLLGVAVLVYALLEGTEAVGLWLERRWAEYLTFLATVVFLPVEVYELSAGFSLLKAATFAINLAIVAYLIYAKRLFGVRGGRRADERARAYDQGWAALARTAPPAGVDARAG